MYANDKISRVTPLQLRKAKVGESLLLSMTEPQGQIQVSDAYTIWRTSLRKHFKNILGKFYKNDDFVNTSGTVQGKDL